jgi:hypothetical protein
MLYFDSFPKILVDSSDGQVILTNIMRRVTLLPSLQNNPLVYYQYDYQDGDRLDIVASKYYSDAYRYWIVLLGNNTIDPMWDLPLSYNDFNNYINDKYAEAAEANNQTALAYTQTTIDHYEMTITTVDSFTSNTTTNTVNISQQQYANTITGTTTATLPSGNTVTKTIATQAVSIYDNENNLNEAKRTINIINAVYAPDLEKQLAYLMST